MQELLFDLYVATLSRAPDPEGIQHWQDEYSSGELDLAGIASNMMSDDEAQDRYPDGLDNAQLVTRIYENLFERGPDSEGLDYWLQQIESGDMSREMAIANIVQGARADTGNPDDAAVIDSKIQAAQDYLEEVQVGERTFDIQEAENIVESSGQDEAQPDPEDITLEDLAGEYELANYTVEYDTGEVVSDEDFDYLAAEMVIDDSGLMQQEWTLDQEQHSMELNLEIIDDSTLLLEQEGQAYELSYEYDGSTLITYLQDMPEIPYDEENQWTKLAEEAPDQQMQVLGVRSAEAQDEMDLE